jgi:hypothetical protein
MVILALLSMQSSPKVESMDYSRDPMTIIDLATVTDEEIFRLLVDENIYTCEA